MEFFTATKVVKLRSHLDKYLLAGDDGETIRQSSEGGSSHKAKWFVEIVDGNSNRIRLKSTRGKYLMASDIPFLLGMTGKKVIQTSPEKVADWKLEWEPIRDGFQVRLRSRCGTFLRANGGTPPWRNTVTHDDPLAGATQRWTLWDVEAEAVVATESMVEYLSSLSSFSSISNELLEAAFDDGYGFEPVSPMSVVSSVRSPRLTVVKSMSPRLSPRRKVRASHLISSDYFPSGMEFFQSAKAVRLRSHHDKYLVAEEDEESVTQDRNGSSKNAKWTVEVVPGPQPILRLKSCYGKYLTASNQPFLLGMTGRKVFQTLPGRLDSSVEWEPIREGYLVKLKTRYGNFLRANGGLPPWRNSVTHDIPHRTATQEWVLWHVDIIEIRSSDHQDKTSPPVSHLDSLDFEDSSPSSVSGKSDNFSRQESTDSNVSFPPKLDGRTIYYHVGDESSGEVDEDVENGDSFHFKGKGIDELTQKLREETGLQDIVVCTRNPLNGKLYPLRLQLPPNNADLHVFVVPSSSKVARDFV
ncbi:hypothetical protein K2173_006363 [Erythroxylum novogranatense]|uniref:Actin cross-linking protein n=1 Tax=Erythroxylum novogranatense TaxID=1862640 RepID=A0AAV8U3D2_9ROSI|nr:hypothetical protein K2173_006363 [Erythroxylum novogranatense]